MSVKINLPEKLKHLEPYIEFLKKLPASKIGESTDTSLLETIIRERIKGMAVKEAQDQLTSDLDELEGFRSGKLSKDVRLGFIFGFLWTAATMTEELLAPPAEAEKIEERLVMELPLKVKFKVDEYSLTAKWKSQRLNVLRCNMKDEFGRDLILAKLAYPNYSEYELLNSIGQTGVAELIPLEARERRPKSINVNLGKVSGHKCVQSEDFPVLWKRVDYLLKIPGGYVSVAIQAGHLFDESEWEAYLATLHFSK